MSLSEGQRLKPLQGESLTIHPYFMSFYQFLNAQILGGKGFQELGFTFRFPEFQYRSYVTLG